MRYITSVKMLWETLHGDSPYSRQKRVSYVLLNEKNGKSRLTLRLNTAENAHHIQKKLKMKVVQNQISYKKRLRTHMSISPCSGARGLERFTLLKYYIVQKWQITFNLGLNAAENTCHIQKSFKWKWFRIKFRKKKIHERICLSPFGVELGGSKDWSGWNIIFYLNEPNMILVMCRSFANYFGELLHSGE